jgi:ribosome-associated protein
MPAADPQAAAVTRHLAARGEWTYSTPRGPGGQRRDRVATEVRLTISAAALEGLPERLVDRLATGLGLTARPLRLRSGTERQQSRNRAIVLARLEDRVRTALAPPPPSRRATRPTRGAVERRLTSKRHRGTVKARRARPDSTD